MIEEDYFSALRKHFDEIHEGLKNYWEKNKDLFVQKHPGEYVVLTSGPWATNLDTNERELMVFERFYKTEKEFREQYKPHESRAGNPAIWKKIPSPSPEAREKDI